VRVRRHDMTTWVRARRWPISASGPSPNVRPGTVVELDGVTRRVLDLRYGIVDGFARTVEETALVLLIHPDFVRAMEAAALVALGRTRAAGECDPPAGWPAVPAP
jgi:hypothetical protein